MPAFFISRLCVFRCRAVRQQQIIQIRKFHKNCRRVFHRVHADCLIFQLFIENHQDIFVRIVQNSQRRYTARLNAQHFFHSVLFGKTQTLARNFGAEFFKIYLFVYEQRYEIVVFLFRIAEKQIADDFVMIGQIGFIAFLHRKNRCMFIFNEVNMFISEILQYFSLVQDKNSFAV